jgi:hypothetical protein
MTVPIQYTDIPVQNIMSANSRYRKQTIIYYGEQKYLTFDLYFRRPYVREGNEKVMVITKGLEFRPDLVSYDYYGFPDNWWKILEANNMMDIYQFIAGRTIMLPNLSL